MVSAGPVISAPLAVAPVAFGGPISASALLASPAAFGGGVSAGSLVAAPSAFGGPIGAGALVTLPSFYGGVSVEGVLEAAPVAYGGPTSQGALTALGAVSGGPVIADQIETLIPVPVAPIVENLTAVQRDVAQSYLVDIQFELRSADPVDQITITAEYSLDGGTTWLPATAQPFDFRHTVTDPITGLPFTPPGDPYGYVWNTFTDLEEGNFPDVLVRITATNLALLTDEEISAPFDVSTTTEEESGQVFSRQLQRRALSSRSPGDFLGDGLVQPLRRVARDFESKSGPELVRSSVSQILGTRAAVGRNPGELPWRPNFGSKLWVLRQRRLDPTLRNQARAFVLEALLWEPRVEVTGVQVAREPEAGPTELLVTVSYRVIDRNVDENRVVLPEFVETVRIT